MADKPKPAAGSVFDALRARSMMPRSAMALAADMRLKAGRRRALKANHLIPEGCIDLDRMLRNAQFSAHWRIDDRRISKALGAAGLAHAVTSGTLSPGERRALYCIIRGQRPARVLYRGGGRDPEPLFVAAALHRLGGTRRFDALFRPDSGRPASRIAAALSSCAEGLGLHEAIHYADEPLDSYMAGTDEHYDVVFLGGPDDAYAIYADVAVASRHLKPNGVIILHGYAPFDREMTGQGTLVSGSWRALSRLRSENRQLTVLPINELPWEETIQDGPSRLAMAVRASQPPRA